MSARTATPEFSGRHREAGHKAPAAAAVPATVPAQPVGPGSEPVAAEPVETTDRPEPVAAEPAAGEEQPERVAPEPVAGEERPEPVAAEANAAEDPAESVRAQDAADPVAADDPAEPVAAQAARAAHPPATGEPVPPQPQAAPQPVEPEPAPSAAAVRTPVVAQDRPGSDHAGTATAGPTIPMARTDAAAPGQSPAAEDSPTVESDLPAAVPLQQPGSPAGSPPDGDSVERTESNMAIPSQLARADAATGPDQVVASEAPETPAAIAAPAAVAVAPPAGAVGAPPAGAVGAPPAGAVGAPPADATAGTGAGADDDFRRIPGVGPKVATALKAAGIRTFAELADSDEATLREAMRSAGVRSAPTLPTWARHARELATAPAVDLDGAPRRRQKSTA